MSMDKKRIETIITGILILVLISAWGYTFKVFKKRAKKKVAPKIISSGVPSMQPVRENYSREVRVKKEDKTSEWLKCPFSGKIYSGGTETMGLRLAGIIWDQKVPLAMINDSIVRIGDRLGSHIVVDIKPDRVILNDGSKDFELRLER